MVSRNGEGVVQVIAISEDDGYSVYDVEKGFTRFTSLVIVPDETAERWLSTLALWNQCLTEMDEVRYHANGGVALHGISWKYINNG